MLARGGRHLGCGKVPTSALAAIGTGACTPSQHRKRPPVEPILGTAVSSRTDQPRLDVQDHHRLNVPAQHDVTPRQDPSAPQPPAKKILKVESHANHPDEVNGDGGLLPRLTPLGNRQGRVALVVADARVSANSSGSRGFGAAAFATCSASCVSCHLKIDRTFIQNESPSVECGAGFSHPACQEGQDGLPPVLESSISPGQAPIAGGRPNPWKTVIDRCYGHAAGTRWAQLSAIWASMTLATSR